MLFYLKELEPKEKWTRQYQPGVPAWEEEEELPVHLKVCPWETRFVEEEVLREEHCAEVRA